MASGFMDAGIARIRLTPEMKVPIAPLRVQNDDFGDPENGGAGTRTLDQRLKRPMLYQLSYTP